MEQNQQNQRRVAAKEFLQSLNQLEDMLQHNVTEDESLELPSSNDSDDQVADSLEVDMAAFEDAVADIEQYIARKNGQS